MNLKFTAHISPRALISLQGNINLSLKKIGKKKSWQSVREKYMWPVNKGKHNITSNQNISIKMRILSFYLNKL